MDFIKNEHKILKFWQKERIFEKLKKKNKGKKPWSFLDGPITANNPMGVHHAWGRTLKDVFQRYWAMKGYDQRFQNGFDCQGLWVEVEVEKELGFKSKKDIEQYGIARFVEQCKKRVHKYSKIQTAQSIRLGQFMDWGDWDTPLTDKDWLKKSGSYYTMSEENNYAIWHFLKKCWQKGWLYKGRDSVPWCPRCGTAISQHEILSEEYQELTHQAVFLKFRLITSPSPSLAGRGKLLPLTKGELEGVSFLVWTTTPWTLPGNVALAVHPDFDYVIVKLSSNLKSQNAKPQPKAQNLPKAEFLILLKEKADILDTDYKIIKTIKGKNLAGLKYQGLFDDLPAVKKSLGKYKHKVVLWKDVTQEEGAGIVHIAPGCGAEDFALAKQEKLPVIDLSDDESRYRQGFSDLAGQFVGSQKVRDWIFDDLKQKGSILKIEKYKHRYPTCWRCKSELIFRVVNEWYIAMDKLRRPMMTAAKKIKWIPEFGLERELDWLGNMHDWLISKKRYWGLALPIFECAACGNFEVIGSRQEFKKRAIAGWQEFDGQLPHRPWVDMVKIKCSKCGQVVTRIADVGNPWLDAGIVAYSTMRYFTDKKYWQKWFPADLICESFPGQFRNWFYSLIAMSVVLENRSPVKTIFGYVLVKDEKGQEMHKSKGNAIWFDEAAEKMGVDVMRWLYCRQNPGLNLNFGYRSAREIHQRLVTLWNTWRFLDEYKNTVERQRQDKNILDKWILARIHQTIHEATVKLDKFDSSGTVYILELFLEDFSNWYVRLTRKSFNLQVYKQVLRVFVRLCAPFTPFLTEEIYQDLKRLETSQYHSRLGREFSGFRIKFGMTAESIHLTDWPKVNQRLIDKKIVAEMKKTQDYVEAVRSLRTQAGIKMRQPLSQVILTEDLSDAYKQILSEEANVKVVETGHASSLQKLAKNKHWLVKDKILALDTRLNPQLKLEGLRRELVRQVNDLRKQAGLKISDKAILVYYFDKSVQMDSLGFLQQVFDFKEKDYQDYYLFSTQLKSLGAVHGSPLTETKSLAEKTIDFDGQKAVLRLYKNP